MRQFSLLVHDYAGSIHFCSPAISVQTELRDIAVYINSPLLQFLITWNFFLQKRQFCPYSYFTCIENNCSFLLWRKLNASVWITCRMDASISSLLCSRRRLYYVGFRLNNNMPVGTHNRQRLQCWRISIHFILFYEYSSLSF